MKKMVFYCLILALSVSAFSQNNTLKEIMTFKYSTKWGGGTGNGDVNGDGIKDFCMNYETYGERRIAVHLGGKGISNNPDYTIGPENGVYYPRNICYNGDHNGDGINDIAILDYQKEAALVYFGSSDSENLFSDGADRLYYFDHITSLEWGNNYFDCDFDNDGKSELMYSARDNDQLFHRIYIFNSNGETTVTEEKYGLEASAGDFNGDKFDDLVLVESNDTGSSDLVIYYGSEKGIDFKEKPTYLIRHFQPAFDDEMQMDGDFNNDGFDDLVIWDPALNDGMVTCYYGNKEGILKESITLTEEHPYYAQIYYVDVNGDGVDDIAASAENVPYLPGEVIVYKGKDDAAADFRYKFPSGSGNLPHITALGDINEDGYGDIFAYYYSEGAIISHLDGQLSTTGISDNLVEDFKVSNYPNPFNPTTQIVFNLENSGNVSLKVFNIKGESVFSHNGYYKSGESKVKVDLTNNSGGTYIYQVKAGNVMKTGKMLLIK